MAPSRSGCRWEMLLLLGCILLSVWGLQPALSKVCHDPSRQGQDNSNWYMGKTKDLPIMVLMPMNESALMSGISQGIEPAVELAIEHIRESRQYSFSLVPKIYDTEVNSPFALTTYSARAVMTVTVPCNHHTRSHTYPG